VDLPSLVHNLKFGGREDAKPVMQMLVPIKANNKLLPPILTLGNEVIIGAALVSPVIAPLPTPLLLTTSTTQTPPLPTPVETEVEKNESTTVNPITTSSTEETTTTTSTTTTTETSSQVAPAEEVITTTAPTTTTTSTTTPKPNETLPVIVELQEPNPPTTPLNQTDVSVAQEEAVPPTVQDPLQQELERERVLERDLDHEAVAKTEYETVEYIPNLVQPPVDALTPPPSKANALEEDSESVHSNSVHAEYPHAAQSLQIPEEPPEE